MVTVDLRPTLGQRYFASTKDILEEAIKASGMPQAVRDAKILDVPAHTLFHFTLDDLDGVSEKLHEETYVTGGTRPVRTGSSTYNYNRTVSTGRDYEDDETDVHGIEDDAEGEGSISVEEEISDLLNEISTETTSLKSALWTTERAKRSKVLPSIKGALEFILHSMKQTREGLDSGDLAARDSSVYD
jgi:hypothetical protein